MISITLGCTTTVTSRTAMHPVTATNLNCAGNWTASVVRLVYRISISHDTACHKKGARQFAVITIIYYPLVNSTFQERLKAFDRILSK